MKQYLLNNLDKLCIGFAGLFFFEILQKYYNLKYYNKYANFEIKKEKVYQIEMYKKNKVKYITHFINKKYINNIKFIDIPCKKYLHSLSIIFTDNNYTVFNNVRFINPNPTKYLIYQNDKFFEIVSNTLKDKTNCNIFLDSICKHKNDNNIIYKIINTDNAICLYNYDKLCNIADKKNDILNKSIDVELSYLCGFITLYLFIYYYKKLNFR